MNPSMYAADQKRFEEDYAVTSAITSTFQTLLKELMSLKGMTIEQLADEVGINARTIGRYREGTYAPGLQVAVAICMALKLDVRQATELVTRLGLSLLGTRRESYAYLYVLQHYQGVKISEANLILRCLGVGEAYLLYSRKA